MKNLLFPLALLCCLYTNIGFASYLDEMTKNTLLTQKNKILEKVENKTLWHENNLDRFYFGKNGRFTQQFLQDNSRQYPAGYTLSGSYFISSENKLCWKYDKKANIEEEFCYYVTAGANILKKWGKYDDPVILSKNILSKNEKPSFFWNRWNSGNLILSEKFSPLFKKKVDRLKKYKLNNFSGSFNNLITQLPTDTLKYYETIVDSVISFPMGAAYHNKKGEVKFIKKDILQRLRTASTQEKIKLIDANTILEGTYYISDNTHCWFFEKRANICQIIDTDGSSLLKGTQGFIQHMDDGFTRIIAQTDIIKI